ncbi:hypothetical protein KQE47_07950 [Raoultella planticola]|uniref:hypothetical protein n=1 Tax=Raoultella TaxID=160674 RepID=UPI000AB4920B|nr:MULTISPECIES: hypothetical protein [Raoultella]EKX4893224.1 hypothetical protein [Raoultella ornithinolytica]MCF1305752.1 hypothetical protein [Raoultella ornithinolytica]MCS7490540.1 hypothetical protein [Raoultella planticola]MDC3908293.1 hypothetical protein [Raoultella planticola]VTM86251.1 Uncharacterised protein [Raoultella ornithinolytica]
MLWIDPYIFYHLTYYCFAAADIPVANDIPVHYADAIRCNVRIPQQGFNESADDPVMHFG